MRINKAHFVYGTTLTQDTISSGLHAVMTLSLAPAPVAME